MRKKLCKFPKDLQKQKINLRSPLVRPPNSGVRNGLNCAYRLASFAAGDHRCTASGEPSWPPVPIACNTKKRRSNHNANECCVN